MSEQKRSITDLYNELESLQEKEKFLKAGISALKLDLESRIKPGATKDGVTRTQVSKLTTSWKSVLEMAAEKLIPKTRLPELEAIKNSFTTASKPYSLFKRTE